MAIKIKNLLFVGVVFMTLLQTTYGMEISYLVSKEDKPKQVEIDPDFSFKKIEWKEEDWYLKGIFSSEYIFDLDENTKRSANLRQVTLTDLSSFRSRWTSIVGSAYKAKLSFCPVWVPYKLMSNKDLDWIDGSKTIIMAPIFFEPVSFKVVGVLNIGGAKPFFTQVITGFEKFGEGVSFVFCAQEKQEEKDISLTDSDLRNIR